MKFSTMWQSLGFKNYSEYLNSPLWKDKSTFILRKYPVCELCRKRRSTQVHHVTYENVGNEGKRDLMALCSKCHKKIHDEGDENVGD